MVLLAVDTGTRESAYVSVDSDTYRIIKAQKLPNEKILDIVRKEYYDDCVVEMFSNYGGGSGKDVFKSIIIVGRVLEAQWWRVKENGNVIPRIEVKKHIVGSVNANDSAVIRALKDRFGEKGTKKNPGWFYGVKMDCWQAYALAVTYLDRLKGDVFE